MLGRHGSIVLPQNSEYAKEMQRWESTPTEFGKVAGRPYVFREFPKMLYKAIRGSDQFERFTVHDEHEQRNLQSRGFSLTQQDALDVRDREQTEHGKLAAERNYEIAHGRISERAAAEVRQAEASHGATHLPAVPETPIRRPGRPRKDSVPA